MTALQPALSTSEIGALTSLRAPLAWWVVIYHLAAPSYWLGQFMAPGLVFDLVGCGYVAVDIFFLLSGYILGRVYADIAHGQWRAYAVARIARLWPLHLFALLLCLPFVLRGDWGWWLPVMLAVCAMGIQAWIPPWSLAINPPAWSIADEAFFAAIFPACQRILRLVTRPILLIGMIVVAWLAGLIFTWAVAHGSVAWTWSAVESHGPTNAWDNFVRFFPLLRVTEFFAGMALAAWHRQVGGRGDGRWLVPLGLILLLAPLTFVGNEIPYLLVHNGLLLPGAAALIIGLCDRRWDGTWLCHPLALLLGRASFAMYLLHTPVLMLCNSLFKHFSAGWDPGLLCKIITYLVLVQASAVLAHLWIEEPARRFVRRRFSPGETSVAKDAKLAGAPPLADSTSSIPVSAPITTKGKSCDSAG